MSLHMQCTNMKYSLHKEGIISFISVQPQVMKGINRYMLPL